MKCVGCIFVSFTFCVYNVRHNHGYTYKYIWFVQQMYVLATFSQVAPNLYTNIICNLLGTCLEGGLTTESLRGGAPHKSQGGLGGRSPPNRKGKEYYTILYYTILCYIILYYIPMGGTSCFSIYRILINSLTYSSNIHYVRWTHKQTNKNKTHIYIYIYIYIHKYIW